MSLLKYEYKDNRFRDAFLDYTVATHPTWTIKTARTCVSDAVFVKEALTPGMLDYVFANSEWNKDIEAYLIPILVQDVLAMRKNPRKDAKGYLRAFRVYFSFIHLVTLIESAKIDKPRSLEEVR